MLKKDECTVQKNKIKWTNNLQIYQFKIQGLINSFSSFKIKNSNSCCTKIETFSKKQMKVYNMVIIFVNTF